MLCAFTKQQKCLQITFQMETMQLCMPQKVSDAALRDAAGIWTPHQRWRAMSWLPAASRRNRSQRLTRHFAC